MMHDVIFYRVKSIYIIFWWMTFDDRWTLLLTLFFSSKTFFQVNLEATLTLSWIDTRYKPNKDFFVGDNE